MTLRRFSPARNQRTSSRNRAAAAAAVADAGRTIAQAALDQRRAGRILDGHVGILELHIRGSVSTEIAKAVARRLLGWEG